MTPLGPGLTRDSNQSAFPEERRNDEGVRNHFSDMKTPEAIYGTELRKYACPMVFVSYLPQRRANHDAYTAMFGNLDDNTFISVSQKFASQEARRLKMIGVVPGSRAALYPGPVSLHRRCPRRKTTPMGAGRPRVSNEFLSGCWEKTSGAVT